MIRVFRPIGFEIHFISYNIDSAADTVEKRLFPIRAPRHEIIAPHYGVITMIGGGGGGGAIIYLTTKLGSRAIIGKTQKNSCRALVGFFLFSASSGIGMGLK